MQERFKSLNAILLVILVIGLMSPVFVQAYFIKGSLDDIGVGARNMVISRVRAEVENEMKFLVQSTVTSLEDTYKKNAGKVPEEQLLASIYQMLDASRYGEAGYFFAYQPDGIRLVAPENKAAVGKNLWEVTDKNGTKVVQGVIKAGLNGGEFTSYIWLNPASGKDEEKISYSAPLRLGDKTIIIGTGTYLAMLSQAEREVAAMIDKERTAALTRLFIIAVALNLLVMGVVYFFIRRSVLMPIQKLNLASQKLAQGDLSTADLGIKEQHEVGQLARSFEHMAQSLRDLVRQVSQSADQIAASSEELTASAEQSAQAANQVAVTITEVAQGTQQQLDAVNEASAVTEEIAASVQDMAGNAGKVAAAADNTAAATHSGKAAVSKAVEQMNTIGQGASTVQAAIEKLSQSSRQIGEIVDVISSIAGQTNLLALNAAIEAARAGEHGRGFAVVADEVRKLAEQSEQSAQQIAELIKDNTANIEAAVSAMTAQAERVKAGVQVVNEAGSRFEEVAAQIDSMSEQVKQITAAVQEVAGGTQQIVEAVRNIETISKEAAGQTQTVSAATEEQSASAQEIASSSQMLVKLAEDLQQAVQKFRL